jgi:hypothetical protein
MKKFNEVIFNKLLIQAEEAKDQGMIKLANGILSNLGEPEENKEYYSSTQLREDVYNSLWAAASSVIKYYDVESVDAGKVNDILEEMTDSIVDGIKNSIGIDSSIGPLEPKLPGEYK